MSKSNLEKIERTLGYRCLRGREPLCERQEMQCRNCETRYVVFYHRKAYPGQERDEGIIRCKFCKTDAGTEVEVGSVWYADSGDYEYYTAAEYRTIWWKAQGPVFIGLGLVLLVFAALGFAFSYVPRRNASSLVWPSDFSLPDAPPPITLEEARRKLKEVQDFIKSAEQGKPTDGTISD